MERGQRILGLNERDLLHPRARGAEIHIWEISTRLVAKGYH
jgi:hypothetical protein